MKTNYPRIGEIYYRTPKGRCCLCGEGKSNQRVVVQINQYRDDDNVYTLHDDCILGMTNAGILKRLLDRAVKFS